MDPFKPDTAPFTPEEEAEVRVVVAQHVRDFTDVAELAKHVPRLLSTIDALRKDVQIAVSGWTDMRVTAAGMRRNANYALDQWEGEEGPLGEEEQQEVKSLLVEISATSWPIPWAQKGL